MLLKVADEYNDAGHLIYACGSETIGAFTRGKTREEALEKFSAELAQYRCWRETSENDSESELRISVVQKKISPLQICDADSDILLDTELPPLSLEEYESLKSLALKSARDFLSLYDSVPQKDDTMLSPRNTFYGAVPLTAREMYEHTKNVNSYYFGEIRVKAPDEPDICTARLLGFEELEKQEGFLRNTVYNGSYNEQWNLRKVFRRFLWHDRIHAKAMYKMAVRLCGADKIKNPFCFFI